MKGDLKAGHIVYSRLFDSNFLILGASVDGSTFKVRNLSWSDEHVKEMGGPNQAWVILSYEQLCVYSGENGKDTQNGNG